MKVNIQIECSPAEARAFLGLPNIEVLNDHIVGLMKSRMEANLDKLQPEEMMKNWAGFGVTAQEQFMKMMQSVAQSSNMASFTTPKAD